MPALVEPDRLEVRAHPGGIRALADVRRRERLCVARPEHETDVTARAELVLDEVIAERGRDRHGAPPRPALGPDRTRLGVPGALDADDAGSEVDVFPAECEELAAAEARVHRRCPDRAVPFG